MSAGHTTTHWDKFRSVATDVSDEYDSMCVYMLHPNTLWLHWLQFTQPSRQVAYTVCTCCVQLVVQKRAKLQNCPAELSSSYCKSNRFVEQLLLDDAGSPSVPDC